MEDFVSFELAKKLKEKGFNRNEPFAMYNELGVFHKLYSSADFTASYNARFRDYYDYDDFDEHDFVAPTISQVLKWLREEKKIHISIITFMFKEGWCYEIIQIGENPKLITTQRNSSNTYEEAALLGIEYVIDNLI